MMGNSSATSFAYSCIETLIFFLSLMFMIFVIVTHRFLSSSVELTPIAISSKCSTSRAISSSMTQPTISTCPFSAKFRVMILPFLLHVVFKLSNFGRGTSILAISIYSSMDLLANGLFRRSSTISCSMIPI